MPHGYHTEPHSTFPPPNFRSSVLPSSCRKTSTLVFLNFLAGTFLSNSSSNSAYVLPAGSGNLHTRQPPFSPVLLSTVLPIPSRPTPRKLQQSRQHQLTYNKLKLNSPKPTPHQPHPRQPHPKKRRLGAPRPGRRIQHGGGQHIGYDLPDVVGVAGEDDCFVFEACGRDFGDEGVAYGTVRCQWQFDSRNRSTSQQKQKQGHDRNRVCGIIYVPDTSIINENINLQHRRDGPLCARPSSGSWYASQYTDD